MSSAEVNLLTREAILSVRVLAKIVGDAALAGLQLDPDDALGALRAAILRAHGWHPSEARVGAWVDPFAPSHHHDEESALERLHGDLITAASEKGIAA